MRKAGSALSVLGLLGVSLFISACGGGNSAPPPIGVALTPSAQQLIDQGQSKNITAAVTNDSMAKGVTWAVAGTGCTGTACGTLTNATTTSVTYNAPATVAANLTVSVTASSVADTTKSASVAIVVSPPPAVTTTTLPDGSVGTAYSQTLQASGGAGALTWSLSAGTLPAGLALSAAGVISGTPTTQGTSNFTVQVADSGSPALSATQSLSLKINPAPLVVTTSSLPNGTVNSTYSATLQSSGGTGAVTWSITVGTLPAGLTLNPATGAISGTPTTSGTSTFTVQAADSGTPQQTATKQLSILVNATLSVTTASLPSGTEGTAYSQTLQSSGGTPPVTWSVTVGTLPTGLTLAASTGVISGTPTAQGTFNFTVQAADSSTPLQTAQKALSIVINAAPLAVTTTSLPNGTVGSAYSATLNSSGGTPPVTWSISVGALPAGLMLNATTGAISGTPTANGTTSFTAKATDSATPTPQTATQALSIAVNPAGVNNSLLNGHYAFSLSGFNANGLVQLAGTFIADGAGNLTSGVEDINTRTGVTSNQTFTGTYSIGADNRGTLTLTNAQGTFTYALALGAVNAGVAAKGRMITFDTSGTNVSGALQQQDTAAFSNAGVTGSFAFGAAGADSGTGEFGVAGRFTSDGAGGINSGLMDVNDGGTLLSSAAFTGTYSVAANGRGTAQFVIVGVPQPVNMVFYILSAKKLFIVGSDPVSLGGSQFAGQVEQQVGAGTFTLASLNGKVVFAEHGSSGGGTATNVLAGLVTGDGAGNITFSLDENSGGTVSALSGTGTYTVASTGRVVITPQGAPTPTLVYLAAAGKGFVLESDTSAETGSIEPQTGGPTFTNASVSGAFFFGPEPPRVAGAELDSGVVTLDGAGNVTGTSDSNANGTLTPNNPITDTYTVAANGRVTFGSGGSALYIISPTKAVLIDLGAGNTLPTLQAVEK